MMETAKGIVQSISNRLGGSNSGAELAKTEQTSPSSPIATQRAHSDAQLRYLSHATFLEEAGTPSFLNGSALAATLFVAGFVGWAAFTDITEVSHAPGEVVPTGFEQVVQHLDGGIVRKLTAATGDLVEKGQVLMTLDDGTTSENLRRAVSRRVFLELSAARLRAIFETSMPDWSTATGATAADIDHQARLFNSALEEQRGRERVVMEQIEQKRTAATILEGQLSTATQNKDIVARIRSSRRELHAKQLIAYPVLARSEQDVLQVDGEIKKLGEQIKQNSEALLELGHRLDGIRSAIKLDASTKLNETMSELGQLKSSIDSLEKRHDRLELRAPVRGLVKSVQVTTLGGILGPGQTVMTIVPVDEELVVEVQVSARDIGHVRVGQDVHVKFSAYDFARYGIVKGKIERLSASAFAGKNGDQHYKARVKLEKHFLGEGNRNRILPGMTVMADIRTGQKSVLDYLLKPVKATTATAFNER